MKKRMILLLILMLTVGFASVSVNLILSGKTSVAFDKENLQVIFTRVRLNNEENENVIITDEGKSFVYIADNLTNVGDTSNIEYDIKNKSSNYDASVIVSCTTDYPDNIEYTGNTLNQIVDINAGVGYTDTLTTKLTNVNTSSNSIALKCTLIINPIERDNIMLGSEYNISFDANGGSVIDASVIVKYYEKYGELPLPTKPNNEFLGWYTEAGEKIDSSSLVKEKDNHTLIAKWKETCPYEIGKTWDFEYTGNEQEFPVPCEGSYQVELWGAHGGNKYKIAGGGYVKGNIVLKKENKLFMYVGKSGANSIMTDIVFNYGYHNYTATGGGSTDVRLINGTWNDLSSLTSRIMVAAGGGSNGELNSYDGGSPYGGSAGGLVGYQGGTSISNNVTPHVGATGATQTSGHSFGQVPNIYFGGETGFNSPGGNGYWSGYYYNWSGNGAHSGVSGAGGGSSFISGHKGCIAIINSTSTLPRKDSTNVTCANGTTDITCSYHYSNMIFTNTKMIDGEGYAWTNVKGSQEQMPNPSGGYYNLGSGHTGNGYARITLININ